MLRGQLPTTAIPQFFAESPRIRSAGTRKQWRGIVRRFERRYPDKRINEYTGENLRDFLLLDDDGRPTRRAHTTIATQRTALRSFFSWAHYAGLHHEDPALALTRLVNVKPSPVRTHHWLNGEEIEALFAACHHDPCDLLGERDALAIAFGVLCGLRIHEIANVRWGDLNLRGRTVSVLGKGHKLATLSLPASLVEMLTHWRARTADGLGRLPSAEDPVLIAFRSHGGEPWRSTRGLAPVWNKACGLQGLRTAIEKRAKAIGLPELAPHDLRRTFAGRLEDKGVPLQAIRHALRHTSIATTERYLADNPSKFRDDIVNALGDLDIARKAGWTRVGTPHIRARHEREEATRTWRRVGRPRHPTSGSKTTRCPSVTNSSRWPR